MRMSLKKKKQCYILIITTIYFYPLVNNLNIINRTQFLVTISRVFSYFHNSVYDRFFVIIINLEGKLKRERLPKSVETCWSTFREKVTSQNMILNNLGCTVNLIHCIILIFFKISRNIIYLLRYDNWLKLSLETCTFLILFSFSNLMM